jgi:hypothetical protein
MRRQFRLAAAVLSLGLVVAAGAAGYTPGTSHTYVVQPGDSLWAISQQAGISVYSLAAANGMNLNDILLIGRRLYIPPAPGTGAEATSSPSASSSPPAAAPAKTIKASTFCAAFRGQTGPWGQLPWLLLHSPSRMALEPLFETWAYHYDLSLPLLEAVGWQESGWQQDVVSSTGAVGVGQIEPATAAFISGTLIGRSMNINSASDNIHMSAAFLAYLADQEGNNRCETIASYYEGPLDVAVYGVYPDTQAYVASVEALIPEFS